MYRSTRGICTTSTATSQLHLFLYCPMSLCLTISHFASAPDSWLSRVSCHPPWLYRVKVIFLSLAPTIGAHARQISTARFPEGPAEAAFVTPTYFFCGTCFPFSFRTFSPWTFCAANTATSNYKYLHYGTIHQAPLLSSSILDSKIPQHQNYPPQ